MSRARVGFTLIEMLISLSLLSAISATTVAVLSGGMHVWQRAGGGAWATQHVQLAWEEFQRDARQIRHFSLLPFDGRSDTVAFAALVDVDEVNENRQIITHTALGRVGYYADLRHRLLCRSSVPFREAEGHRLRETCSPVLTDVRGVHLRYYGDDPDRGGADWFDSWEHPQPPVAIRLEVEQEREAEGRTTHALIVRLPTMTLETAHAPEP